MSKLPTSRRRSCQGFGFARVAGLIAVSAGVTLLASVPAGGTLATAKTCEHASATQARGPSGRCLSVAPDVTADPTSADDELSPRHAPAVIVDGAVIDGPNGAFRTPHQALDSCLTQTQRRASLRAPPGFDSDPSDDTDDDDGNDGDALAPARVTLTDVARHSAVATVLIAATVMATPHASLLRGPPRS